MVDLDLLVFNIGTFICAVFVLDYGADRFIDHTAIVARRLGLDESLIALLTAGAEWEELAVVIAALSQRNPSLALGNVIGSSISNILGAFSLGLLFRPFSEFDRSARVYSLIQLGITMAVAISLAAVGPAKMGKTGGSILVASFFIYLLSIAYSIYRGIMNPPEAEQSDSDSDVDGSIEPRSSPVRRAPMFSDSPEASHFARSPSAESLLEHDHGIAMIGQRRGRHLRYHLLQIVIGFLALSISGYVLSHSASSLSTALGLSETVMGLTILSFATTLPEKFVSFMSGSRGHSGILVAATAGSNIFLLTLCMGVALVGAEEWPPAQVLMIGEIGFLCVSACIFAIIVWLGTKRWIGIAMLAGYVTFLTLEFTIWRR